MLQSLWIPAAFMALDWIAVYAHHTRWQLLTKACALIALLVWVIYWIPASAFGRIPGGLLIAALGASLAGDILLGLPRERFLPGLIAFLVAHIAYIVALQPLPVPSAPSSYIVLFVLLAVGSRLFRRLEQGLRLQRREALRPAVAIYAVVISLMLLAALLTLIRGNEAWPPQTALLVGIGALLFYISDAVLAWNRFVSPVRRGRLWVRVSYHLGQLGLAAGLVTQLVRTS
jgi:uncharacterized membrane protein YhhN